MIHSLRSFILVVSLGSVFAAEASALKCEAVFKTSTQDVLESLQQQNSKIIFSDKTFTDYTDSLSWLRRRKIRKLVQDVELAGIPSEKALERYSTELSLALFGQKNTVNSWLFQSPKQRFEESSLHQLKEQLILQGLQKTWSDQHNPLQVKTLAKWLDHLQNFHGSAVGQLARFPFALPSIKNKTIPDDLMVKVIRDGFEVHADEIQLRLGKQTRIDAYHTFRRLYSPIFFGVTLIVNIQYALAEMDRMQHQQVDAVLQQLQTTQKNIEANIPLIKQEIFQKAYQTAVQEFIQKWGEPPTPAEQTQLKAKIEKALNMN